MRFIGFFPLFQNHVLQKVIMQEVVVPDGASSEIEFVVPMNRNKLTMFQIHIMYLLLDTVTGYRSQYHGLSAIGSLA